MVTVPIRVKEESKKKLSKMKKYPRETYADVVERLLDGQSVGMTKKKKR